MAVSIICSDRGAPPGLCRLANWPSECTSTVKLHERRDSSSRQGSASKCPESTPKLKGSNKSSSFTRIKLSACDRMTSDGSALRFLLSVPGVGLVDSLSVNRQAGPSVTKLSSFSSYSTSGSCTSPRAAHIASMAASVILPSCSSTYTSQYSVHTADPFTAHSLSSSTSPPLAVRWSNSTTAACSSAERRRADAEDGPLMLVVSRATRTLPREGSVCLGAVSSALTPARTRVFPTPTRAEPCAEDKTPRCTRGTRASNGRRPSGRTPARRNSSWNSRR
mmetsp:Transcript_7533/g.18671  ORF Transcript_7533/g.18671 Transcript_7533/m.18671 type:complete len:278 (+) Transcript_7533:262-1095(+)